MLFPYTYVPHQMDQMQSYVDFIFAEVWCKAPTEGPFGLHLFDANAELRELMEAFWLSDSAAHERLKGKRAEGIFHLFT